ncbi:MAG: hypothetical protein AB1807_15860 [Pseudomonadota bacterium]
MTKLLKRAEVLAAEDLKHEDVPVPAWGGVVRVRMMTGTERDEFREVAAQYEDGMPPARFAAALLALSCVDEDGERLFTLDDLNALEAKAAGSVDIPAAVSMRLNGFGAQALAAAEKNSASGQSDDSGSDSPSPSAVP